MASSTVCLIAKDEERAILEWIAYQKVIGFDQVVVYNNDSSDRTVEIVKAAQRNDASISLIDWPNEPGRRPQPSAYNDAITHCRTDWIAFFDTDEFLLLKNCDQVNDYLRLVEPQVSAVLVNWLVFGSSGHEEAQEGLVIENFTRCARVSHVKNLFCKTIARPERVDEMWVHSPAIKSGEYSNGSGNRIEVEYRAPKLKSVKHDHVCLNHYLLKSREDYMRKVRRGHAARALEDATKQHISDKEFQDYFWRSHDVNDVSNTEVVDRYKERLVAKMAFLSR